jgi:hypothetical protein
MIVLLWFLLRLLPSLFNSTTGRLEAENAALRHQLIARRRTTLPDPRPERDLRRSRHTPATRHGHPRQSRLLQARRGRMRYAVRRIGTIRRERVEAHLRRILGSFAAYYNKVRVHRSLDKDAHSMGRLSTSVPSHHDLLSAVFTIIPPILSFRHTQPRFRPQSLSRAKSIAQFLNQSRNILTKADCNPAEFMF